MKQTSIDYLENSIKDLIPNDIGSQLKFKNKVEQAKEMHEQEIIDAFDLACEDENRIGQEYYNETFKKQIR